MVDDGHNWQDIISAELKDVSAVMHEATRDRNPEIQEIFDYALDSPGKMIRPSMIILSCRACGGEVTENVIRFSAAAELVHMSTLIHDDINDESESRRGKIATYRKYGVRKSLATGDLMMVKAMSLFDSDPEILQSIISMGSELADSEFVQFNHKFDLDVYENEYYRVISGKTAAFLAQCTKVGAIVAGAAEEVIEKMYEFGRYYGMAFQIADDLIDLTGTDEVAGKTTMRDLSEGVITLPTILAMRDKEFGKEIRSKLKAGCSLAEVRELIMKTDAVAECKAVISDYVDDAIACLEILPDSIFRKSMADVTRLNLTRLI